MLFEVQGVIQLGTPLSAGYHLDVVLEGKREELMRLSMRLELMPSHDSLYLLRNVFTAPRLVNQLWTSPCTDSPVLPLFDATSSRYHIIFYIAILPSHFSSMEQMLMLMLMLLLIRESLSATLKVELSDDRSVPLTYIMT